MTEEQYLQIGNNNVEKHLADAVAEYVSDDGGEAEAAVLIGENAYILAFDAMVDAGCKASVARKLATQVSKQYMGK